MDAAEARKFEAQLRAMTCATRHIHHVAGLAVAAAEREGVAAAVVLASIVLDVGGSEQHVMASLYLTDCLAKNAGHCFKDPLQRYVVPAVARAARGASQALHRDLVALCSTWATVFDPDVVQDIMRTLGEPIPPQIDMPSILESLRGAYETLQKPHSALVASLRTRSFIRLPKPPALHRSWWKPWFQAEEPQPEPKAPLVDAVADEAQTRCAITGEPFEVYWSDEREDWCYRGAVVHDGMLVLARAM